MAGKIVLTEIALILLGCVQITRHVDPQPCSIASSKINCATCKMHSKNARKKLMITMYFLILHCLKKFIPQKIKGQISTTKKTTKAILSLCPLF